MDVIEISSDEEEVSVVLCQRLSDSKSWMVRSEIDSETVQFHECFCPEKRLNLHCSDRFGSKYRKRPSVEVLPDLLDEDFEVKYIKREPDEEIQIIKQYPAPLAISPSSANLRRKYRLVSKRYVFFQYPVSHAALKSTCGNITFQDNSSATKTSVFANWKNEVLDITCSSRHLLLPSLLRLMTSNGCGMSDQALKQCIRKLMAYKKPSHLYSLYSTVKALAAFHPRSSQEVNCRILDKLPQNSSTDVEHVKLHLVLDFIVSFVELELLHYPRFRRRSYELSQLLDINGALISRLIEESKQRCHDVKTLALLQRSVAAVGISDKYLLIDRLVSKLYRLYCKTGHVHYRQRLLLSVCDPKLQLKLAECILRARCHNSIHQLSRQFLSIGNVHTLSALLADWLQASSSSGAVGSITDQVEEYLAVVVTYLQSNIHIHKDIARSKDIRNIYTLHEQLSCQLESYYECGKLEWSLSLRVLMDQLYCLEDVLFAAL